MLEFPNIKPYIFKIGPIQLRWYGLMYLIGFVSSYVLVKKQIEKRNLVIAKEQLESFYFSIIVGLIIGARLGYVLFYNFLYYLNNPLDIFAVWHGGMSFHGGLIGVIVAGIFFSRKHGIPLLQIGDLVTATAPIGLFCGRMGNFINGELYGRVTDVPWGMVFPEGGSMTRHPSQLYEAFFEGPLLFVILWFMKDRIRSDGMIVGLFLICYGTIRFIIEFFREPDSQLGLIVGPFSMGQALSSTMALAGMVMVGILRNRKKTNT